MNCEKCGKQLHNEDQFCTFCREEQTSVMVLAENHEASAKTNSVHNNALQSKRKTKMPLIVPLVALVAATAFLLPAVIIPVWSNSEVKPPDAVSIMEQHPTPNIEPLSLPTGRLNNDSHLTPIILAKQDDRGFLMPDSPNAYGRHTNASGEYNGLVYSLGEQSNNSGQYNIDQYLHLSSVGPTSLTERESNNRPDQANRIEIGQSITGNLSDTYRSERDWFIFSVPGGQTAHITLNTPEQNSSDYFWDFYVYTEADVAPMNTAAGIAKQGAAVAWGADPFADIPILFHYFVSGNDTVTIMDVLPEGTYYIRLESANDHSRDEYTIHLSAGPYGNTTQDDTLIPSSEDAYLPIINAYAELESSNWKQLYFEEMKSAIAYAREYEVTRDNRNHDWSGRYPLSLDGFMLADLNFDGVPELMIFGDGAGYFYGMRVFAVMQSGVEKIFQDDVSSPPYSEFTRSPICIQLYRRTSDLNLAYVINSSYGEMYSGYGSIYITDRTTRMNSSFQENAKIADYSEVGEPDENTLTRFIRPISSTDKRSMKKHSTRFETV